VPHSMFACRCGRIGAASSFCKTAQRPESSAAGSLPPSPAPRPVCRVNITMTRKAGCAVRWQHFGQRPNLVPAYPFTPPPGRRRLVQSGCVFGARQRHLGQSRPVHRQRPGMSEIDSSLQKRFRVTERLALNFRAGVYNLLNHPVYSSPSGKIGTLTGNPPSVSGSFGPSPASSTPALSERARPAVSNSCSGRVLATARRQPPTRFELNDARVPRASAHRARRGVD